MRISSRAFLIFLEVAALAAMLFFVWVGRAPTTAPNPITATIDTGTAAAISEMKSDIATLASDVEKLAAKGDVAQLAARVEALEAKARAASAITTGSITAKPAGKK